MSRRGWSLLALASLISAALIAAAGARLVLEPPVVNVRWRAGVSDDARAILERRFTLGSGHDLGSRTYSYELLDRSADNIRRLVGDGDVEDTHHIDRQSLTISGDAPLGPPRLTRLGRAVPPVLRRVAAVAPLALLAVAGIAGLLALWPLWCRRIAGGFLRVATRGVPEISPRALGVFRLLLGVLLAGYLAGNLYPQDPLPVTARRMDTFLADLDALQWLGSQPGVMRALQAGAIVCALVFALGLVPSVAFTLAAAGAVVWLATLSLYNGGHPFGVLAIPLVCLTSVPWAAAPPLHRLRDRTGGAETVDRRYGFAPWMLTLALGAAFASAAWSKLREGPEWILNGTVKYAFVADADLARVDWGLTIATWPTVAVVMSACAVLVEALVITAAFARAPRYRLAAGAAAASLLCGFLLLQGLFWPAWWILLAGFLPWEWIGRGRWDLAPAISTLTPVQGVCAGLLVALQLAAAATRIELEPFSSRYDMYSATRSSPEDYDRENPDVRRRVVVVEGNGTRLDITGCASTLSSGFAAALQTEPGDAPARDIASVGKCHPGVSALQYLVLEDQRAFDWTAGRFYWKYRDHVVATLPAAGSAAEAAVKGS